VTFRKVVTPWLPLRRPEPRVTPGPEGSLLANGLGGSAVALVGRHKFDRAVVVPVVVPINERQHPFAGLVLAGKGPAGVIRPVFDRTEQRFRVRVVVGDPRPGKRPEHVHLLQP